MFFVLLVVKNWRIDDRKAALKIDNGKWRNSWQLAVGSWQENRSVV
jgi:hypothetical protein